MRVFLAGDIKKAEFFESMKTFPMRNDGTVHDQGYIDAATLESFYYARKNDRMQKLIPMFKDFLLDSGAFTFMNGSHGKSIDWEKYVEEYAEFVKRHKVAKYLELDIDSITGYAYVKKLRAKLEGLVGYRCIPVWHKGRGKEEFLRMCDAYPYVAIGGIVTREISQSEHRYFPWFISEAHKRSAKIHGLGYTNLAGLRKYHFDSVDSTAWTTGNRFGHIYRFDGKTLQKISVPSNMRLNTYAAAQNNFTEWIKFQRYAEKHL